MPSRVALSTTRKAIDIPKQPILIPPLLLSNRSRSTTSTTPLSVLPSQFSDLSKPAVQFTDAHTHTQHCPSKLSHLFYSSSNLFSRLRSPPHLSEARRLHALLLVGAFFHPSTTVHRALGSQLVNVYVQFGRLEEALLVFHNFPQKSNVAWNGILRGFIDGGQFSQVIELYHLMLTQGMVPDNFTYPLILKACSGLSAVEQGRKVQELIQFNEKQYNLKPNIYVYCAMIDMFAKCGSWSEAWMLFENMPEKDLASWTAIVCGTVHNGESLQAILLFRRMRAQGVRPDSVIMATVLPACGRLEAKQVGMTLQGCAVRSGFHGDLFVSNALMDMYCKCGDTHEASLIFCSMVYKDTVSWSTLIAGYSQNYQYRHSIELYLDMISSGVRTNEVTAASVLPGFAKLKLLKQGKELHNYILKQGFECDVVVGSTLIDMYFNCGSRREAEHIFESMSDRDITIWNSIIAGCVSSEDFDSVFRIFRRIWKSKLTPNSITLVSILPICGKMGTLKWGKEIHGCATRMSLGMAVSVGNSLVDMYCKCGYLEIGVKVFHQMMQKNVVTYNTIISAYGFYGYAEEALRFFHQMNAAKIRPNKVTFVGLLSACSHAGLVDRGWFLYNSMTRDYRVLPDMEHYSCMVDLLGRAGQLVDACKFIGRMPVEAELNVLGSLLGACRIHNKAELADFIGKQIFEKELEDDSSGYHVLLSNIYASTERWEDAAKVRTMIKGKSLIKIAGRSWIQIGFGIYMFNSRDTMHPEFNKIQQILDSLLSEMKNKGLWYTLFSHYHVGS
ncbi:unnamed protein product [Ilex paraguariensis]